MAIRNLSLAHFPDEILVEIFLNLPVTSLFVIRSVCKHWLGLIESPTFIRLQLNHPINDDHNSLLTLRDVNRDKRNNLKFEFVLTLMSGAYMEDVPLAGLSPSMVSRDRVVGLLGPCNGLFGITDRSDIVIFNPVTRRYRQVPFSPSVKLQGWDDGYYFQHFCFGFDSASNDYKILGFNAFNLGKLVDESSRYRLEMSVFRFSTHSWTQLDSCVGTPSYRPSVRHTLFFNDACHWSYQANRKFSMAVFDLNKEALKQFDLPIGPDIHTPHLTVLGEYMAIAGQSFNSNNEIEIWVMKEYGVYNSWTKLYNIDVGAVLETRSIFSFSNGGEFLFWDHSRNLGSFNLNTRVVRVIEELGFFARPWEALRFRGSLVSPGRS